METNRAAENLQTIRTLMERSALYRRALAPIMTFNGVIGMIGAIAGWLLRINSPRGFVFLWFTTAVVALVSSFLLVRRQALKDSEPFWSPPTRRVAQALTPAFLLGLLIGVVFAIRFAEPDDPLVGVILTSVWSCLYGCALHSAGALMPRGVRRLSWLFIAFGCVLLVCLIGVPHEPQFQPHLLMGVAFSGLHLAYGLYLYFTEPRGNES